MLTVSLDIISLEIRAADRSYQHRCHTYFPCLIDERTQHIAISRLRVRTACIGRRRQTMLLAIRRVLEVIHTIGHGSLIIMRELDQQVIAGMHLALESRPIRRTGVESTGVGTGLAFVIDCHKRRIEERTEVHTPASLVRRTLVVLRHRGVSDRVHFDSTLHHRQAQQHGCEKAKNFSHSISFLCAKVHKISDICKEKQHFFFLNLRIWGNFCNFAGDMYPKLKNRPWKVVKSENILRLGPWLSVRQECVEMPSGKQIPTWYVMEFPDWINVIAITKDGKMVMEDQYRHALGETHYELVAGVVDPGETPLEAAKRELSEETGYEGGEWKLFMTLSPNPTNHNNLSYTFLATGVEKVREQHQEPTEDIHVDIMEPEQVLEMLRDGEIIQALHAAPLWKYFAENK